MRNIIKELIIFTLLVISFIYIVNYNVYIGKEIIYAVDIWLKKVFPTLFPSFILADILVNSKIPYYISKYLHINYIYIISIISGSPTNALILSKYNKDVTKLMSVNLYTSPIFLYTFLKLIFNKKIAILLIIINIISNIILIKIIKVEKIDYYNDNKKIFNVMLSSISKGMNTLINILGTIILFNILPINLINNTYIKSFLFSILEITSSFNNLLVINIPLNIKLLFCIISISTCGLCIQMQIKSIISDTCFNYKYFIKYRLLHLIINLLLCYIILQFLCHI